MIQIMHWRRSLLSVLAVFAILVVQGQYNITAMLPSGSIYQRSQLWNLSVSNSTGSVVDVKIHMEMKDLDGHQSILSAVSNVFTLSTGMRAIQERSIEPIQYSGLNALSNPSSNALLPVGHYQVCYELFVVTHQQQDAVADDCEQIEVEPLSPPLLTMPENDSLITVLTPNFTWAPPGPISMFKNLNYGISISEIFEGQSVTDAIQNNIPLQQVKDLYQPFLNFPLNGPQLEKGKRYVWQVMAKDDERFAARSEAWSFRVGDKKDSSGTDNSVYLLLDNKTVGVAIVDAGIIRLKYISSTAAHEVPLTFTDETATKIKTVKREINQGDNYLDILLNARFTSKHVYTVTLADDHEKTTSLTFTIK